MEFIVPGSGIVDDTWRDAEVIIPGFGIYDERGMPFFGVDKTVESLTTKRRFHGLSDVRILSSLTARRRVEEK